MNTVDFDDKERITIMNSDNGEKIPLDKPVVCMGGVEVIPLPMLYCRIYQVIY
jgi:hypothetical protein